MKINYMTLIFWFNTYEKHQEILAEMEEKFKNIVSNFKSYETSDNLLDPVIVSFNEKTKTEMVFSKINFQFAIDLLPFVKFSVFKEQALEIFDFLTEHSIKILHTSIIVNAEIIDAQALKHVTKNIVNSSLISDDLVDVNLKFGKKYEDLFYKVITVLNKKQLNLPKKVDEAGYLIPIPLISWYNSSLQNELIEITYEINDKYSFDNSGNYCTTTFFLNKLLYVLENDFEHDINNLIEKGNL